LLLPGLGELITMLLCLRLEDALTILLGHRLVSQGHAQAAQHQLHC